MRTRKLNATAKKSKILQYVVALEACKAEANYHNTCKIRPNCNRGTVHMLFILFHLLPTLFWKSFYTIEKV